MGNWLARTWRHRGITACLLWPVSLLYGFVANIHRGLYRLNIFKTGRCAVPVIVVGNVVAGGAGKTPLVIALAKHLQLQGLKVGVVSRGYGRQAGQDGNCLEVRENTSILASGDEPAHIYRALAAPVFVAKRRFEACRELLSKYPLTQVIISDDGLQHHSLARDIEIVVFDDRGIGNGWRLPAGPLREPWLVGRNRGLVLHTGLKPAFSGFVSTRRLADHAIDMDGQQVWLDDLKHLPLVALAGIANPNAFFNMLRARELTLERTFGLPDHHDFSGYVIPAKSGETVLCTEKDAVKLFAKPTSGNFTLLAVPLIFTPEPAFFKAVDDLLLPLLPNRPNLS